MPDPKVAAPNRVVLEAEANRMRRLVYSMPPGEQRGALLGKLLDLERTLAKLPKAPLPGSATILSNRKEHSKHFLSAETTGLDVRVDLKMLQLPSSAVHLLDPEKYPLVEVRVKNASIDRIRRVRVTTFVEGYSAHVVDTVELAKLAPEYCFRQTPAFFPERLATVRDLTRALVNVCVEDLDGKVELQNTKPFWIAPYTSAALFSRDPADPEKLVDLTRYLAAYVTPNEPNLMRLLRDAARLHSEGRLIGYQGEPAAVEPQAKALFDALNKAEITYVNSVLASSADTGTFYQRVRLPRESLAGKSANCLDGTVLFASLLEAISLSPVIVLVPGHAFVGWQTWSDSTELHYLETTMIGTSSFEEARQSAEQTANEYKLVDPPVMVEHSVPSLRLDGIYPIA